MQTCKDSNINRAKQTDTDLNKKTIMQSERASKGGREGERGREREREHARFLKETLSHGYFFQAAKRERWTKMPVELTLRRIMKGEVQE